MEDETFISRLIFSDEATFHLSGTVNRHNVRIWGTEQPHETVEHERDSPNVNVFSAVSQDKVYGPFFFEGNIVTGQTYPDMLQNSPARSLTVCDFFLWGYVKDHVYVPPPPTNLNDLKHRITAINSVHRDMLIRAWEEFSYGIDVARAAGGGHIEHL
ncbi:hypothetical protein B7P43_G08933 [Cryptotermes secundus]|uniref:Uncharacterized protein n=1 Tax=Cryptotermes secundus TaxID=105785 RepID=A0A2J7PEH5_9NEOP|nr:hypothetical protein B7P43_G08933 [Cryptotermes secundus]